MNLLGYFIYSPTAAQSLFMAGLLRKYFPRANIVGVLSDDELCLGACWPYNAMITTDALDKVPRDGLLVPTGAISTKDLLTRGDITLGSVTLTQSALLVFDKLFMIEKAGELGIPVPVTWQRSEEADIYPLFYKERCERGGGARGVARSNQEIPKDRQQQLVFQEYIDSQGTYGVGFLADKGRLLATHTHFERESTPREGGSAVIIERFEDDRLLDYTRLLVQSIGYSGWGLSEFKYCPRRKDYVFMEINAKFWASCELAFLNEPMFLRLLFGIKSREAPVGRMVFVDRAFSRGILFVLNNFSFFFDGSTLRLYRGWFRRIAARLLSAHFCRPFITLLLRVQK